MDLINRNASNYNVNFLVDNMILQRSCLVQIIVADNRLM